MKLFNITSRITLAITVGATLFGCTDLEEKVIDEVVGGASSSPQSAIAAAYGQLGNATFVDHGNVWGLQEYPTDEAMLPTRGSDWGDGGKWRALTEFTWGTSNDAVSSTWNNLTSGIVKSLTAIEYLQDNPDYAEYDLFMAESRVLLAFYVYNTLDLFGQAPYRDPFSGDSSLQMLQADTYIDTLIAEVESQVPQLADLGTNNTYNGRFTKQAAYAFLADMYLNRAVFKDRYNASSNFNFSETAVNSSETDMDRVIYYTSLLINGGFSLESNYFANFAIDNTAGSELIFVVAQENDGLRNSDNDFAYMSTERGQKPSPNNRGTNASCIEPEFYHTWDGNHDDPRFQRHYQYSDGTWFMNDGTDTSVPNEDVVPGTSYPWFHFNRGLQVGLQYGPLLDGAGGFVMQGNRIKVNPLYMEKAPTQLMDFTPELNFSNPAEAVFAQSEINRGVRCFKFEFDPMNGNGTSRVDIPLYRLGGMYCMRAEAYFRKGNTAAALADINMLRTSRHRESLYGSTPGTAITSLNTTTLYNEIGYEMYWEMYRRKQMIRFGTFDAAYTAKAASQPYLRVYAIPQAIIDVTKEVEITQNTGY